MNDQELDTEIRRATIRLAESAPAAPSAADLGLDGSLPTYTSNVHTLDNGRSRRRMFGGLAAGAGITAGGVVTLNAASGGGADTSSPSAAVEEFVGAIANEDVIGLLESMDPGERDMLQLTFTDVIAELDRLDILDGADLAGIQGFDIEVADLVVEPRQLSQDMYAVRIVSGTFTSTTDASQIPVSPAVADLNGDDFDLQFELRLFADEFDAAVMDIQEILDENNFEFVVTNHDGWHVDLDQTLWHAVHRDAGWATPDYETGGITPQGAESPESAATRLMAAQTTFDLRGMLSLADPVELDGTLLHGESFIAALESEGGWNVEPESTFEALSVSVEGDGARRTVSIDTWKSRLIFDDLTVEYSFDGTCMSATNNFSDDPDMNDGYTYCPEDLIAEGSNPAFLQTMAPKINVVERDGRWFVSALGTAHDSWMQSLGAIESLDEPDDAFLIFSAIYSVPIVPGSAGNNILLGGLRFGDGDSSGVTSTTPVVAAEPTVIDYDYENDPINQCFQRSGPPPVEQTRAQSEEAGELLAVCLTEAGMQPAEVQRQVAYQVCTLGFGNFQSEPTDEELAELYGTQADCLEAYGIQNSYRPSAAEIRAERECGSVYDDFYESDESLTADDADFLAVDKAYQDCIAESLEG